MNGTISEDPLAKSLFTIEEDDKPTDTKTDVDSSVVTINQSDECEDLSSSNTDLFLEEPEYEDVLERYLELYGTTENWLRSYGGPVSIDQWDDDEEHVLDDSGEIIISFSRELVFPR